MEIKQFLLDDKSVLILTVDEDMSIDDAKAIGKIYQEALPDTPIILNHPSFVKEITVIDRPMKMGDNWFDGAAIT